MDRFPKGRFPNLRNVLMYNYEEAMTETPNTPMAQALKPCPFCGCNHINSYEIQDDYGDIVWLVLCGDENCGVSFSNSNQADSESRWNTRTVITEKKLFNSSYADKVLQSILPIHMGPAKNAKWCTGHRNGGTISQYLLPCDICGNLKLTQGENK